MAEKKRGLGKGLDFLFEDNANDDSAAAITLKLSDIEPNKDQARKNFDEEALSELAASIAEHGVLQPLLVRPLPGGGYQLIAGERRWRAARIAGLTEVPVTVKTLSDEEASVISLIENLQREDLNPVEEARGFADLIESYGLTQEEAAKRVGKSRPAVANSLRLLKLPAAVIKMVEKNELSAGHAKALAGIENDKDLIAAAKLAAEKGFSVRECEKLVKSYNSAKKPKTSSKTKRNSYFDEVELALNNSLGRKARVITKGNKENGVLELTFYNKEDLSAIVKALETLE
ncbi:MAG: ParB/RepB/Spo0J family partition protein [Clostridia bacterium]|nr:ParB/RepB/Spo0J family partition protein [Clostridia bacterium]